MKSKTSLKQILSSAILLLVLVGCSGREPELALATAGTSAVPAATEQTGPIPAGVRIDKYPGNYTSFKIETSQGVILIADPYGMDEDVRADIVTLSHHHSDHADFSRLEDGYRLIDTDGAFIEKGITITGVAGHHNKGDAATTNVIYVFDIGGLRLAQFASQGELPTEAMFAQIGAVDVLVIQIYGAENGKLSAAEAGQIAQRLQAKMVIPAHTDVSQTDHLASLLMAGESEKIASGRLMVTRADLAAQSTPRVVVLDRPEQ